MQCHKYVLSSRGISAGAPCGKAGAVIVLLLPGTARCQASLQCLSHILYSRVNDFGPPTIMGHCICC